MRGRKHRLEVAAGSLVAGLGCGLAAQAAFSRFPVLNHLELDLSPARYVPATAEVRLVNVTRATFERLGLEQSGGVIPRDVHARLVRRLKADGARVVLFDYDFSQGTPNDDPLREALGESAPMRVVLGAVPDLSERRKDDYDYSFAYPTVLPSPFVPENVSVGALVAWEPDLVLRGVRVVLRDAKSPEDPLPHAAVATALAASGLSEDDLRYDAKTATWYAGKFAWPVGADGEYRTSWAPDLPPALDYADALDGAEVRDDVVIVSSVLDSARSNDIHPTEVGDMQGARFLANVIESLLSPRQAERITWFGSFNFSVLLAAFAYGAVSRLRVLPVAIGIGATVGLALLVPRIALGAFDFRIDGVPPLVAISLASVAAFAVHGVRSRLQAARWTPAWVKRARRPGAEEIATILFVDLQGSTALAVEVGLRRTREIFRAVMEELSKVVREAGGEVERTLGDGIFAVFRERELPDHAMIAVSLVPRLQAAALRTARRLGFSPEDAPGITIGIETGPISGDIVRTGEEVWSSFGVTIHAAARLQGECGKQGLGVLLGPGCQGCLTGRIPTREVGSLSLKGLGEVPAFTLHSPEGVPKDDSPTQIPV